MLVPSCPRCPAEGEATSPPAAGWRCSVHGAQPRLLRADRARYDDVAETVKRCAGFPALIPWPMTGWGLNDIASVGDADRCLATLAGWARPSELDGVVDLQVIVEEPGVGLGSRCAGLPGTDPGVEVGQGAPSTHLTADGQSVALWAVSTSAERRELDRFVFAGEWGGRWLWLILRPPSSMLSLREGWSLGTLADLGPQLLEVPITGPPPPW